MRSLNDHHKEIVAFLEEVKDTTGKLNFISSETDERKLLDIIIKNGSSRIPQMKVAEIFETNTENIGRTIRKNLNRRLKEFCIELKINPPIRLYFNTKGEKSPGGHFACCEIPLKKNHSDEFIGLKELRDMIEQARQRLGVESPSIQPKETLKLQRKVIEVDKNKENQNLFRFEYCWPAFVGRDEEMQRLYKFVNYENENLLWWTITGNGGTGKSRLALELCCQLEKQGWYAGFLTNTNGVDVWRKWEPQKPTLIIVDYTHEKAKELGEHIGNKYEESKQWNHPVRILFLERNKESEALKQFCRPHREILENNIRYHEVNNGEENESLELEGLGDGFIESIIIEVFKRYTSKRPSADKIEIIKSFLKEERHENRPLYTMFVADACARGEDVRGWDTEKLHESVLEHNKNIWKRAGIDETKDLDKKHINLLTLATMTNGVDIRSTKYNECLDKTHKRLNALNILPAEHEFRNDKYKILCDDEISEELSPMAPDILGGYFILQRWKGDIAEVCEMKLLTKIAWQYNSDSISDFIFRIASDFPSVDRVATMIRIAKACDGVHSEPILLCYLVKAYTHPGNYDIAVQNYNSVKKLWGGNQRDKFISSILASVARVLIAFCYLDKKLGEAVKCYDCIESLWKNGRQKDQYISRKLAESASIIAAWYYEIEKLDKGIQYYDRLEELWRHHYRYDILMFSLLHSVTYNCAIIFDERGNSSMSRKFKKKLEELDLLSETM